MDEMLEKLTPDIYQALRRALELGKWPDGRRLTDEQKALCMEAVIRYEAVHLPEQERVGYIDRGSKQQGELCDDSPEENPLRWTH